MLKALLWAVICGLSLLAVPSLGQKPPPNLWKPPHKSRKALEQQQRLYARSFQDFTITGMGSLWQKTTGLTDWQGLRVRDRRLARAVIQHLRFANERDEDDTPPYAFPANDRHYPQGSINVFLSSPAGNVALLYNPRKAGQSEIIGSTTEDEIVLMRQRQKFHHWFFAFVNRIARRARAHDPHISYFINQCD